MGCKESSGGFPLPSPSAIRLIRAHESRKRHTLVTLVPDPMQPLQELKSSALSVLPLPSSARFGAGSSRDGVTARNSVISNAKARKRSAFAGGETQGFSEPIVCRIRGRLWNGIYSGRVIVRRRCLRSTPCNGVIVAIQLTKCSKAAVLCPWSHFDECMSALDIDMEREGEECADDVATNRPAAERFDADTLLVWRLPTL